MRVLYLHGFASSPASRKAQVFLERLRAAGAECEALSLDGGDFEHMTIASQLAIVEKAARGEAVVLIGSSMGAYVAALYAARHPEVQKLVLMAPAFAFARRWPERLGADAMAAWRTSGTMEVFHYADEKPRHIGYRLMEDGLRYEDYPAVTQPTLIFHGRQDDVVPYQLSLEFDAHHPETLVTLYDSGHDLGDVIEEMWKETERFLL